MNMVEKVARGLHKTEHAEIAHSLELPPLTWEECNGESHYKKIEEAIVAIETMEEPTEEMVVGISEVGIDVYRTMIRRALKGQING